MRDLDIGTFIEALAMAGGTDLHLKVGAPPRVRISGDLHPLNVGDLEDGDMYRLAREAMPPELWHSFHTGDVHDVAFAYESVTAGRFRVACSRQRGSIELVLRRIPSLPRLDALGLADPVVRVAGLDGGLVVVTGPARSGKTTTLAALVAAVNATRRCHVVTIEDPVEYVFGDDLASVSQRSVGVDAVSTGEAIRFTARQDPDVVCVSAVRNCVEFDAVLDVLAAGILVFVSLDADGVVPALERILGWYGDADRPRVRSGLSRHLRLATAQRLVPASSGEAMVVAAEILVDTREVASLLRGGDVHEFVELMSDDGAHGMQTMEQALAARVLTGEVDAMVAATAAPRRDALVAVLEPAGISMW
ncbi:MAG: ATPase, T2SS/T4P/T4SS family [Acidimicrobiia bacterium]